MLRSVVKTDDDNVIKAGSVLVLYEGFNESRFVTVEEGGKTNGVGQWAHADFIGRRYGDRVKKFVASRKGGWHQEACLLRPTAELWTDCLTHRTQILYMADISFVCMKLGLRNGSRVVEAGTGSGSLSHSLARAVHPTGQLHTFDFHEVRSKSAAKEFAAHGLSHVVTARHRDVCKQYTPGCADADWAFGLPAGSADAVFLDVPQPWLACLGLQHTLRPDGIFCNYSPCIEQVQKVCLGLDALGFKSIETFEVLRREFRDHTVRYPRLFSDKGSTKAAAAAAEPTTTPSPAEPQAGEKRKQEDAQAPDASTATPPPAKKSKDVDDMFTLNKLVSLDTMRGHTGYLTFAKRGLGPTVYPTAAAAAAAGEEKA